MRTSANSRSSLLKVAPFIRFFWVSARNLKGRQNCLQGRAPEACFANEARCSSSTASKNASPAAAGDDHQVRK